MFMLVVLLLTVLFMRYLDIKGVINDKNRKKIIWWVLLILIYLFININAINSIKIE